MYILFFILKSSSVIIHKNDNKELYAYIGSIIKDNESIPILINGMSDHIHILCVMSKNIALAKLVEEIKRHSSRWINTKGTHYAKFDWQGGYGGFSASPSLHDKTKFYIANQDRNHKKLTFNQEYLILLEEYGIEYNENYLWMD